MAPTMIIGKLTCFSLKPMDNKTWKVIIKGWKHLVTTSQDGTSILNPEAEWSNSKYE